MGEISGKLVSKSLSTYTLIRQNSMLEAGKIDNRKDLNKFDKD